jgi:hypothetical protein
MAETRKTCFITAYGRADNDPPGGAIANPIIHQEAGGIGTFADPVTIAVCSAQVPYGKKMYIPTLRHYFIAEDYCQASWDDFNRGVAKWRLDVWAGDATAAYESSITGDALVIFDPEPNYAVNPGVLYDIRQTKQGDTVVLADGGTPPPPPPTDTQPCPGTVRTVKSFGYSWISNSPQGAAIAYPGGSPRHLTAQGNGSYANPVTIAVENALLSTYPKGSRLYIDKVTHADGSVAQVDMYGVVEDFAGAGAGIGIWVGGAQNNGQRNTTTTNAQLTRAEAWVTGTATVIANPGLTSSCPVPFQAQIALNPAIPA